MATAYLLRHKDAAAFDEVPDTQTLPAKPWIPVLIRCRDLGEQDLCRCFTDFLTQHLNKTELLPADAEIMRAVILDRVAKGDALLLVDGLDEITDPRVRMMFCQELERTAVRYPDAPIVVTSRIVGYRDMPYRMRSGFEHGQIAELSREDKDLFARRWVEVTEQHRSTDEKAKRAQELIDALHSNDRIERLTGNPMLLTTLALVKRKVGKLPSKRSKLYAEAVSVLLNWNPRTFQVIEEDEAMPQLEFLAYEMCRRGVQQLTNNEALDLLDKLRAEYPNIRAIKRRDPHAFLKHLEERSSILIKCGGIWQQDLKQEKLVWEFRHLTFQEYLAARALLDGRYPSRDKTQTLAEQVAPLAGAIQKAESRRHVRQAEEEVEVLESWREALRLLVADCKDDDVLLAILNPLQREDAKKTARPRAVLASLCLADEPNVSPEVAVSILTTFAKSVKKGEGLGRPQTSLDRAAVEVAASTWASQLKRLLIEEFIHRTPDKRENPGGLWAMAEVATWSRLRESPSAYSQRLLERLYSTDSIEVLSAALSIMEAAFEGKGLAVNDFSTPLLACLKASRPGGHAAAWAFMHLTRRRPSMFQDPPITAAFGEAIQTADASESKTRYFLATALGNIGSPMSLPPLLAKLDDEDASVREAVIKALGRLGDRKAVAPMLAKLDDEDATARGAVIEALGRLGDKKAVAPLLANLDGQDAAVRRAVIEALGRLGDEQAVAPLVAKLDDRNPAVRWEAIFALERLGDKQGAAPFLAKLDDENTDVLQIVIEALGRLGDKRAVAPLLAKLDNDTEVEHFVIEALGRLGDKRAVAPLLAKLNDKWPGTRTHVAAALHALNEPRGTNALRLSLTSEDADIRGFAVSSYGRQRDNLDRRLLSRSFDGITCWLNPKKSVTRNQVSRASSHLSLTPAEIRSRYEKMATDIGLKLSWK